MKLLSVSQLRRLASSGLITLTLSVFGLLPLASQELPPPNMRAQIGRVNSQEPDPAVAKLEKEAEKQRNLKRQKDIQQDSEKLLELATELKQYVDKTNENIISLDVIRKAEQIEKLAKSVKDKMKQ